MADNPDALRVAVDGGKCYIAALGSMTPTGLDAFNSSWYDLGLVSDAGVNEAYEENRTERRPWGYKSPVRTDITSVTKTFQMTLWETNPYTRALYDNIDLADIVDEGGGIVSYTVSRPTGQKLWMLAIDAFDGTNHLRTIVPRAEVTSRAEITNSAEEVIGYNLTWTAYELSDQTMFERYFLSDGMWLPVETLEISGTLTVVAASTTQLTATANFFDESSDDVSADAEWESDDEAIATVDDTGEVTGVAAGTANITATYRGASDTVEMTVTST